MKNILTWTKQEGGIGLSEFIQRIEDSEDKMIISVIPVAYSIHSNMGNDYSVITKALIFYR